MAPLAANLPSSAPSVEHYSRVSDVQTLAMLCSVFAESGPDHPHAAPQAHPPRYVSMDAPASSRGLARRERPRRQM